MATINLTNLLFKEKFFDYTTSKEWAYEGERPALIDFYADWCAPCKAIAPVLEELAEEYNGQVDIYKVDTEKEQELSAAFGIRSIPSLLFVPMKSKQPMMQAGALPKETLKEVIDKELLEK